MKFITHSFVTFHPDARVFLGTRAGARPSVSDIGARVLRDRGSEARIETITGRLSMIIAISRRGK